ncbi:MAG: glycosyltransferase family 2 protein [Phycisphaerales bacterium JB039]
MQTSASAQHATMPGAAGASGQAAPIAAGGPATLRIAVIIVTWNRRAQLDGALAAVARQDIGAHRLDVIVVDNASSDDTTDHLRYAWRPERIFANETSAAHEPQLRLLDQQDGASNAGGFASLTVVRNRENLGGCGGFNTGFCAVDRLLQQPAAADARTSRPDFVWLVDDDIDLPPDACRRLVEAAQADPGIGVVGSRAVDINDRESTFETTIYFDFARGRMGDTPIAGHRLEAAHTAWLRQVGATRGRGDYSGVLEVDVVSACSLLARWSAVREVGFWDKRYFIYCDDADWCLRFARAGWRVALCLDAVVYHTPWFHKLTPARLYYSQRNIVWTLQKALSGPRLWYATFRWMASIMYDALQAAFRRRTFHAEIIRRTAHDIATNRGGKLDADGPTPMPIAEALEQAGALRPGARIAVICPHADFVQWADDLRQSLGTPPLRGGSSAADPSPEGPPLRGGSGATSTPRQPATDFTRDVHSAQARRGDPSLAPSAASAASKPGDNAPDDTEPRRGEGAPDRAAPEWIYLIRNDAVSALDAAQSHALGATAPHGVGGYPERIIYSRRLRSKFRRQIPLLRHPPDAVIVFNQTSDFPLLRGTRNLHIDRRSPHMAQLEPDGAAVRAAFCIRWVATGLRVAWFLATLRRYRSRDRFG